MAISLVPKSESCDSCIDFYFLQLHQGFNLSINFSLQNRKRRELIIKKTKKVVMIEHKNWPKCNHESKKMFGWLGTVWWAINLKDWLIFRMRNWKDTQHQTETNLAFMMFSCVLERIIKLRLTEVNQHGMNSRRHETYWEKISLKKKNKEYLCSALPCFKIACIVNDFYILVFILI